MPSSLGMVLRDGGWHEVCFAFVVADDDDYDVVVDITSRNCVKYILNIYELLE